MAECLAALLPTADIFSLLHSPEGLPASLAHRRVGTSFLQKIPGAARRHREWMPLYPEAARSLDLRGYDMIVSSDSGPVKGARLTEGTPHLCYCHSPMRYLYDGFAGYRDSMPTLKRLLFTLTAPRVRRADRSAASGVTRFIANSQYVANRIRQSYGREAEVVYPPIDLHRAHLDTPGEAYLAAGRLVSYKKTQLMIEACAQLGRPLRIAGSGPEEAGLRRMAGPGVTFLGALSSRDLWREYGRCRALLFAADEDFGMVPLEAQSCGRPVIAYGVGGSLETVRGAEDDPAATGVFFHEQTARSLADAIVRFEAREDRFRATDAQAYAAHFDTPIFLAGMRNAILEMMPSAESVLATVEQARATVM